MHRQNGLLVTEVDFQVAPILYAIHRSSSEIIVQNNEAVRGWHFAELRNVPNKLPERTQMEVTRYHLHGLWQAEVPSLELAGQPQIIHAEAAHHRRGRIVNFPLILAALKMEKRRG